MKKAKLGGWVYGKGNVTSPVKISGTSKERRVVCKEGGSSQQIKQAVSREEETKRLKKLLASITILISMLSNIISMLF